MASNPIALAGRRRAEIKRATAQLREAERLLEKKSTPPPTPPKRDWPDVAYKIAERLPITDLYYLVLAGVFGWFLVTELPKGLAAMVVASGGNVEPATAFGLQGLGLVLFAVLMIILMRSRPKK
jgi:hypothetical protein